jgi:hypothetical protein
MTVVLETKHRSDCEHNQGDQEIWRKGIWQKTRKVNKHRQCKKRSEIACPRSFAAGKESNSSLNQRNQINYVCGSEFRIEIACKICSGGRSLTWSSNDR